jgi:hypothetical protein
VSDFPKAVSEKGGDVSHQEPPKDFEAKRATLYKDFDAKLATLYKDLDAKLATLYKDFEAAADETPEPKEGGRA